MRTFRPVVPGPLRAVLVALLAAGGARPLAAHAPGQSLQAPLGAVAPSLDGTIEGLWGAPVRTVSLLPSTTCDEPTQRIYAMRTATHLYVAIDVPESAAADPADTLLLFVDGNHNGLANPDAADRAIRLVGFPNALNQLPSTREIYTGTGAGWGAAAPFSAVKSSRTGTGTAARLTVEVELPFTTAPLGFALVHLSGDAQDCNADSVNDSLLFPAGLPSPSGAPPGLTDTSQWGDIGRRTPVVEFDAPTCCASSDIRYTQGGNVNPQPVAANTPVDITARPHNRDATFEAKSVNVRIQVHDFGTGSGVVFTGTPTPIPTISPSAGVFTSPAVTWAGPPAGLHGCIRAEIRPPTGLEDYAIGANSTAQRNIDVACVGKGMQKRMMFMVMNPDEGREQRIFLALRPRVPAAMKGLQLRVVQPERPLRPGEQVQVALLATAAADIPVTDVPRQKAQVAPKAGGSVQRPRPDGAVATGGGQDPVRIEARPGDRLHIMASGSVDIDAAGPIGGAGPEGRDVSKEIPEGRFLLSGERPSRVGGALIGSYDNFATSFVVGPELTLEVPDQAQGLSLAVNDVVGGFGDNAGSGFAVEVSTLPAPNKPGGTLPEADVFATTVEEIRLGDFVYKVGRVLGGVTYQILVTGDAGGGTTPPPPDHPLKLWWILILLLILVLLFLMFRKKKTA